MATEPSQRRHQDTLVQWLGQVIIHACIHAQVFCTMLNIRCKCHNGEFDAAILVCFHFSDTLGRFNPITLVEHALAFDFSPTIACFNPYLWHMVIKESHLKIAFWLFLPYGHSFGSIISTCHTEIESNKLLVNEFLSHRIVYYVNSLIPN